MGLAFAARLVKVTEGHVWTVTRGSAIHVSSNGTETMDGLYYPGTLIVMRIPETEREIFALRGLVWVDASANRVATVYTSAPNRLRGPIFADLCTLLHTHGRSRDRAGPRVLRHRRPHGPRDARALGPEVHATGAVTQPPTHTTSRSLSNWIVHVACSR